MAYTALTEIDHEQLYQISLTSISVDDFLSKQWKWNERLLPFRDIRNKDAVIFPKKVGGKYVMFHPWNEKYVWRTPTTSSDGMTSVP